ncbi:hypothetical protein [Streptomyces lonegramiae]|uniref:GNAT family N-acetyltransferase n=1 Tax=Streptomyces lonegramiae TaxID=3075524 RepID=A0ABU2XI83_9ACTN|nr:hypothetical protein [Streptomyces sp. DSM 41529]MDT0545611.1 hypothetical protein [Streptomyces sp. DSM 41529]
MSIQDLSAADRAALLAERQQELEHWPARHRWHIEMHPLLHIDKPRLGVTIPAGDDMELRKVVETFGNYFKSELRFDFLPFVAEPRKADLEQSVEGVLFNSRKLLATFPVAVGAAGLSIESGQRWLDWIWIHPFERGTRLMEEVWSDLERMYGTDFKIAPPISPAMAGFLRHQGVDRLRWAPDHS